MKQLREQILVCAVLVGLSVLATPAFAQQGDGRSTSQHFEIGIHGGYLFGGRLDITGNCTPVASAGGGTDGCSAGLPFANKAGGGLSSNSGVVYGARIGVDITPRWQVEATWERANATLAFQDEFGRIGAAASIVEGGDTVVNPGLPQGFLNIYQFNVNYHLRKTGRVVPFVGAGAGWVNFENPPVFVARSINFFTEGTNTLAVRLAEANSFAFNVGAGVKLHATQHIGFRLEARPLFSFYRGTHSVRTFIDPTTALADGEANNNTRQRSTFVHVSMTAGIFFRF